MLRVTLRGLFARKLRLLLSALSVVLGVAFMAGSFALTDTLDKTFDSIFTSANAGVSVDIRSANAVDPNSDQNRSPVPADLVDQVKAVPGVKTVAGGLFGNVRLVKEDGKVLDTHGAPVLAFNWSGDLATSALKLVQGRAPSAANEVVIDQSTVDKQHYTLGGKVNVLTSKNSVEVETLVGVVEFGNGQSLAGASIVAFDTATLQQLLSLPDAFDDIVVSAQPGVSDTALRDRIAHAVGSAYDVRTGAQTAKASANEIQKNIQAFRTFLLVFAFVSLFVGAFVIANTFQVLIVQRTRELALLRAVGASRRQVLASVISEGAAVGLIGSVLGVFAGLGIAVLLKKVLPGGSDTGSLVLQSRTVIVSVIVGTVVSVAASTLPAWRAGSVPPVAAMRDVEATPRRRSLRRRGFFGAALLILGIGLIVAGLTSGALALVGFGAAATFLGVTTLSPLFAGRVINGLGAWLPKAIGSVGRLARSNAVRNPRRTSATAAALMIGMAIVSAFTVLGASASTSFRAVVHKSVLAQVLVYADGQGDTGVPLALVPKATLIPKVASATAIQTVKARIDDKQGDLTVVQANWLEAVQVRRDAGSTTLHQGELLVDDGKASDKKWRVGDTISLFTPRGGNQKVELVGTYKPNQLLGDYVIGADTLAADSANAPVDVVLLNADPGVGADELAASVRTTLKSVPGLKIETQAEFLKTVQKQIDQVLNFITILLAFAFIIAYFGVINTLVLSVVERTREIGLLRAVGLTRKQLKWTLRWESALISAYGGVLGIVLGGTLGVALVSALKDQGITDLSLAPGRLVIYFVLATALGLVSAGIPGRRAARMKPLDAIATV